MEKFLNLPVEKQKTTIDAALKAFGANGYKKTSVSDIASAAGISKAMIFHYFGTKKALYLYLVDLCGNTIINEVTEKFDSTITDFFDRIKLSTEIEIAVMKKYAAMPSFLVSMYYESDEEVVGDIKARITQGEDFRSKIAFAGTDVSKFKDNVDLKLVMKMLSWIGDGFTNQFSGKEEVDFEVGAKEFYDCMDLLKLNFYKEEYL
ncbi:TetR/AcrR family transcriptional regulator [Clostridium sp.]|uniref:TetR/AcrR family transcriptional regulator n=1 Tax=Clostridium sp. TaxID=1506 RepID=UPI002FC6B5A6